MVGRFDDLGAGLQYQDGTETVPLQYRDSTETVLKQYHNSSKAVPRQYQDSIKTVLRQCWLRQNPYSDPFSVYETEILRQVSSQPI